jgi:hypothetical protein
LDQSSGRLGWGRGREDPSGQPRAFRSTLSGCISSVFSFLVVGSSFWRRLGSLHSSAFPMMRGFSSPELRQSSVEPRTKVVRQQSLSLHGHWTSPRRSFSFGFGVAQVALVVLVPAPSPGKEVWGQGSPASTHTFFPSSFALGLQVFEFLPHPEKWRIHNFFPLSLVSLPPILLILICRWSTTLVKSWSMLSGH